MLSRAKKAERLRKTEFSDVSGVSGFAQKADYVLNFRDHPESLGYDHNSASIEELALTMISNLPNVDTFP